MNNINIGSDQNNFVVFSLDAVLRYVYIRTEQCPIKRARDIKVGIVDLTRKRDSYTLYTYDHEGKRAIAAESMKYASNGLNVYCSFMSSHMCRSFSPQSTIS